VGSDLAYPDHKTKHKPGEPGGQLTTNLMKVVFNDTVVDGITGDGARVEAETPGVIVSFNSLYVDSRVAGEEDENVEAFLFGSGNLGLRMEGSNPPRHLILDFGMEAGAIPFCENGSPCIAHVTVDELNNNRLYLVGAEQDCHKAGLKGTTDLNDRGLLCITPGASRASGFVINWDDEDDPKRRFMLDFRDDSFLSGNENNVLITRCSATDNANDARCSELGIEDDLTWIFSTTLDGELDTGPRARLVSVKIKGNRDLRDYGVFDVPFEFIATCVQNCP
jgi:hypothetical protein